MKKILLLIAVGVMFSVSSTAQLGIKAGMNFAKQSGYDIPGFSESTLDNFQFEIFTYKDIVPLLKIRVGLGYVPKGSLYENDNAYFEKKLNYLELPVLARVKLGPAYALGGFYGAYAMNGKYKEDILIIDIDRDIDFDTDNVSRWDYGMKFGLGFQLGLGPVHAFAELDYSFGFNNLNTGNGGEIKNSSVIGVSVGVLLGSK